MALRSRSRFSQNEINLFDLVDGAIASRRQAKSKYEDWSVSGPFRCACLNVSVGYRCLSVPRKNHVCHVASSD